MIYTNATVAYVVVYEFNITMCLPSSAAGKIADEEAVLKWLTDENTLQLPDQIEEVNGRMLKKFIDDESDDVVVFFCKSSWRWL